MDGREPNAHATGVGSDHASSAQTAGTQEPTVMERSNEEASSGGSSAANAQRQWLSSRPPLPRLRSLPTSVASSREGSPRSGISEAPSLATQAMCKLAQYRAGPRVFKPETGARQGLNTGDVVAFRTKGVLHVAVPVPSTSGDTDAVLHVLQAPSHAADISAREAHLEVIRQGQWVGFRCAAAGDRLLQARRRGAHRLAFFSANLGTWEQWEVEQPAAVDGGAWREAAVTLRHRRLPHVRLQVELVRVGSSVMMPHAAVTPRSLLVAGAEEEPFENPNVKRMSGLLVHEWLNFVEREKRLRAALEQRVEQAVEDAAGLREWAAAQVDGVRRDVEEEVELLLAALGRKTAALDDAQARLTTCLRWGVALLETRKAAALARTVLAAWRARAMRQRYCRIVQGKLTERAGLLVEARALQAWAQHCQRQRDRRHRMRAAVGRMAQLKLHSALGAWRERVQWKRDRAAAESTAVDAATQHMQAWTARRLLGGWLRRARCAGQAEQLLGIMARRVGQRAAAEALGAWRAHASSQAAAVAALTTRAAGGRRQASLWAAFDGWRLAVDDEHGERMQQAHAERVMARQRTLRALLAWRSRVVYKHATRQRWRQVEALQRQRRAARALGAWSAVAAERRDNRQIFVRFVHARAERRMQLALHYWRYAVQSKCRAAAIVQRSVNAIAVATCAQALHAWRSLAAASRAERHRVGTCQRRHRLRILRGAWAAWKERVHVEVAERHVIRVCRGRADRRRVGAALVALQAHAEESIVDRQRHVLAVGWHSGRLQARAVWALLEAARRRREMLSTLCSVARSVQVASLKDVLAGWHEVAGQAHALRLDVAKVQRRRGLLLAKSAFRGWRGVCWESRWEQAALAQATVKVATSRQSWAFGCWRAAAASAAAEDRQEAWVRRRLGRLRAGAVLAAWRGHATHVQAATQAVAELEAARGGALVRRCFGAWADRAAQQAERRAGVMRLVQRQAAWLQLSALRALLAFAAHKARRRAQLHQAVARLARVKAATALHAWRLATEDAAGESIRLGTVARVLSARHQGASLRRVVQAWRGWTAEAAAVAAAVEARREAQAAVQLRSAFACWDGQAERQAAGRERAVCAVVDRRASALQAAAFAVWQRSAQVSARCRVVMMHCVDRAALRATRAAFEAWRSAARARRVRRSALVRFMQRRNAVRAASALHAWAQLAAERAAQREELRRCLVRKRVAFRLFRQWYWDSFDDDLQDTLRAMFEMDGGDLPGPGEMPAPAAAAGGGHYGYAAAVEGGGPEPSPVKSVLSSPIRRQLMQRRAQAQEQRRGFAGAVAERVAAALASADASPAPALPSAPSHLGAALLAPLREYFVAGASGSAGALSPVAEASEGSLGDAPAPPPPGSFPRSRELAAGYGGAASYMSSPLSSISQARSEGGRSSSQASTVAPATTPRVQQLLGNCATPPSALPGWLQSSGRRAPPAPLVDVLSAAPTPSVFTAEAERYADALTPPRPRPQRFAADAAATAPGLGAGRPHGAAPATVYRTPLGDFQTPTTSAGTGMYHTALQGDYSLKSLSQAAASAVGREGREGGFPRGPGTSGGAGGALLRDNPLAGLLASPDRQQGHVAAPDKENAV